MRLALIQSKQNELYDFSNQKRKFTVSKANELQKRMQDENLAQLKEAFQSHPDLILTTEAVNFCGQPSQINGKFGDLIPTLDDDWFRQVGVLAQKGGCYIVLGALNKRCQKGQWRYYNSALVYDNKGQFIALYDKIHLAGTEKEYLTPGKQYVTWTTPFGKMGVSICWDMQFPETARELVLRGADLILCPTWGWEQIYGHARAYENGIYVASAMAVPYQAPIEGERNPSEVVSPEGKVIADAPRNQASVIFCEINPADSVSWKALRMGDRRPDSYKKIGEY